MQIILFSSQFDFSQEPSTLIILHLTKLPFIFQIIAIRYPHSLFPQHWQQLTYSFHLTILFATFKNPFFFQLSQSNLFFLQLAEHQFYRPRNLFKHQLDLFDVSLKVKISIKLLVCVSRSVVPDSLRPHGLQSTRFLCP